VKGKTQGLPEAGPPLVVQLEELGLVEGEVQESPTVTQSPHLLVMTVPSSSVLVAHQGVGESLEVQVWYSSPRHLKGKTHRSPSVVRQREGILFPIPAPWLAVTPGAGGGGYIPIASRTSILGFNSTNIRCPSPV